MDFYFLGLGLSVEPIIEIGNYYYCSIIVSCKY